MELIKLRLLVPLFVLFSLALGLVPTSGRKDGTAPRQVAIIGPFTSAHSIGDLC